MQSSRSILLAMVFVVAAAWLRAAPPPLGEVVDRYNQTTLQFLELGAQSEAWLLREVTAAGVDEAGEALVADNVLRGLRGHQRRLGEMRDYFVGVRAEAAAAKPGSRASYMNSLSYFFWSAAGSMQSVQFEETHRTVSMLQARQRRVSRALYAEYVELANDLKKKLAGREKEAELAAALEKLREQFKGREREVIDRALREHEGATQRLLERRRAICGLLWQVEDFHRQGGEVTWADNYAKRIRGAWDVDLAKMPADSYTSFGGLDPSVITNSNANTIDWLQLRPWFLTDFKTIWQMDDAMRRESTEDYRRRADAPAPAVAPAFTLDWIVLDELGGERVAAVAPVGATVRLRLRIKSPQGDARREVRLRLVRANGESEERGVPVLATDLGLNFVSDPLRLSAGPVTGAEAFRVLGGDRLEAAYEGAAGPLAIEAPAERLRFVELRSDGSYAPAAMPLVFGTEFFVEARIGAPRAEKVLTVDLAWRAEQKEPINLHLTPEDPLLYRSRPVRLLPAQKIP